MCRDYRSLLEFGESLPLIASQRQSRPDAQHASRKPQWMSRSWKREPLIPSRRSLRPSATAFPLSQRGPYGPGFRSADGGLGCQRFPFPREEQRIFVGNPPGRIAALSLWREWFLSGSCRGHASRTRVNRAETLNEGSPFHEIARQNTICGDVFASMRHCMSELVGRAMFNAAIDSAAFVSGTRAHQ
jgi:hypothetical protein